MDVRELNLFSSLSEEDAVRLGSTAQLRSFRACSRLFDAGEPVRGFYHICKGKVKVFRLSPEGNEQVLGVFRPGQTFAEAAVFQGGGYPASAECLEDCELLFLEREALRKLVSQEPDFALRMLGAVAGKLRRMVTLVDTLTLQDVRGRLCRYLLGLLSEQSSEQYQIQLPISQTLLARMLGITGETLSRGLKSLVQQGVLGSAQRGRIVVADVAKLRELGG